MKQQGTEKDNFHKCCKTASDKKEEAMLGS